MPCKLLMTCKCYSIGTSDTQMYLTNMHVSFSFEITVTLYNLSNGNMTIRPFLVTRALWRVPKFNIMFNNGNLVYRFIVR